MHGKGTDSTYSREDQKYSDFQIFSLMIVSECCGSIIYKSTFFSILKGVIAILMSRDMGFLQTSAYKSKCGQVLPPK